MKNKLSSNERHFKMKKDGVLLFLICFLVPKTFTIWCYANQITDDVIIVDSDWCENTKSVISL